jgi:hypothetical protein
LFSFSFPFLLLLVLVLRRALLCNGNALASTQARTQAPATQGLRESHPNQRLISPKKEIKKKSKMK